MPPMTSQKLNSSFSLSSSQSWAFQNRCSFSDFICQKSSFLQLWIYDENVSPDSFLLPPVSYSPIHPWAETILRFCLHLFQKRQREGGGEVQMRQTRQRRCLHHHHRYHHNRHFHQHLFHQYHLFQEHHHCHFHQHDTHYTQHIHHLSSAGEEEHK